MRIAKFLIRLGGCPGWSESSLGAQVILLVLSLGGLFLVVFYGLSLTPQPLYNTIVNFCLSYPTRVKPRVKCIDYIGKGVLNSHLRSNPDPCYNKPCYKEVQVSQRNWEFCSLAQILMYLIKSINFALPTYLNVSKVYKSLLAHRVLD